MTRFVDVSTLRRMLSRVGAGRFLSGIAAAMREDFRRWESFGKSARLASHSEVGVIELMPIANRERFAFKYVNGHPANTRKGLSTVMAFGMVANRDGPSAEPSGSAVATPTGEPLADLSDGRSVEPAVETLV